MKWIKVKPNQWQKRTIRKFLFLPKEINGVVRWLEFAEIEQIYHVYMGLGDRWEDNIYKD